jgi:arylformamidase
MTQIVHGFTLEDQPPFPHPAAAAYSDRALELSARPQPGITAHRDIAYGSGTWQRLDVFTPENASAKSPVLVFLHGGGWMTGYKEWGGLMAPGVIASGAILVAPTYRFAPAHRFPVFLEDCLDAMAAIRERIATFDGDPDRIFVSGHSAGGHLAAMVALRRDLWAGRVSGLRGALPVSAILDLAHPDPAPGSLEEAVYLHILAKAEDDVAASPVSLVDQADVPFSFAWGEHDTERVRRSNTLMDERMSAAGKAHESICYPGLDHFGTHLALADPAHPWYASLRRMLAEG